MPPSEPLHVDARGMKCPWPALRAARAMRAADAVTIEADDPNAAYELEALTQRQGWKFLAIATHRFELTR
ncbi:sulfurtransferase TusA family protein [Sphingobium tyrosinilyticum]|uniref:Sulfurtransferase TusA family protein n=1 Tax=Sphingobium tyrosinilyticum TaxID=2715436 RepID=A0ABV9EXR6_9SPHN